MINVFSFCLYGPRNPRYYTGMIQNIQIIQHHFPSWKVYIYIAPDLEPNFVEELKTYSNVVLIETHEVGAINMIHRFYAIDDPNVEVMMVRDADSRVHWKDRWAIREFLKSSYVAHTIRDNVMHTAPMMGGLWGLRKSSGLNIHELYKNYKEDTSQGHRLAHDQNFLLDVIYPLVIPRLLVHYSNGRKKADENAVEFPFEWANETYCGRIEYLDFVDRDEPQQIKKPRLMSFLPTGSMKVSMY